MIKQSQAKSSRSSPIFPVQRSTALYSVTTSIAKAYNLMKEGEWRKIKWKKEEI